MLTGGKTEKRNMMTGYAAATSRMELKVMDQQFSSTTARNHSTSAVQKKEEVVNIPFTSTTMHFWF